MKLLEGSIPEGKKWRTLALITPERDPGQSISWRMAIELARAGSGEAVSTVILPPAHEETALQAARQLLDEAAAYAGPDLTVHCLIIETNSPQEALTKVIQKGDIDLLLADGDSPQWQRLNQLPCAAAVVRGSAYRTFSAAQRFGEQSEILGIDEPDWPIRRLLVPTSGGPNSTVAFSFLMPLLPNVEITALYVAPSYLGENEVAHGEARLRQLTAYVDGSDRIKHKVIQAESVTQGIVDESSGDYDLVIIGATRESGIDRALFGDVVGAVIRESKTPVSVVWEPSSPIGSLARGLAMRLQNVIPRLTLDERTDVYVRIRRSARPNVDFYVLIGLSALIAALGLLLSSPAVVIGAMLVAPLMSPMIGAGLAIVLGNPRFLRLSVGAVIKGALLAIGLGVLIGVLQASEPLTPEILARTQPTLLDLGVAVFAGLAGAYALAHSNAAAALPGVAIAAALVPPLASVGIAVGSLHWREALGALLLFCTNLIAIIAAAVLIFVILGFRPTRDQKAERALQQRSVQAAMVLLATITLLLGVTTFELAAEAQLERRVNEVVELHVEEIEGVDLAELLIENLTNDEEPLTLHLTVRSTHPVLHSQVEDLRGLIGQDLQPQLGNDRSLAMTLTVIRVTMLDPEVPPTPTSTPNPTATPDGTMLPVPIP
jgi:uncharacterized hydrophobic protein (TIGR00271 family)